MRKSAGILMYRRAGESIELLLVHPGGPVWAKRDLGAWSVPKGEYGDDEEPFAAAQREFQEETGLVAQGEYIALPPVKLKSGKVVSVWAMEGDCDAAAIRSNTFVMEWPPKSKRFERYPEVDRTGWFGVDEARVKLNPGLAPVVDALCDALGIGPK